MKDTSRRKILQVALAAAFASPAICQPAKAATRLIAPPEGPMLYRRMLARELHDHAWLTVTREFSVTFVPIADGFLLDGSQENVSVQGPANLAAFMDIEEARLETGLFPITLDTAGLIQTADHIQLPDQAMLQAVEKARLHIASLSIAASERDQLDQLITAIRQAGRSVTSVLPTDLFAPTQLERHHEQTIALPTGEQGYISSRFEGQRDPLTGLMRRASREVTTVIKQDRRRTRETWELASK